MPRVVTLEDFSPTPRFDSLPWTQGRIEEAPAATGPWTALETQNLSPVDGDPSEPASRNFTTALAVRNPGWYRVVFLDAAAHEDPSDPVLSPSTSSVYTTILAVR